MIIGLSIYVPAKDFELSKRFYIALGFSMSEGWGGTADFALNGHAFQLQDYYAQDWANNFMFVIGVQDVEAWHQRALELLSSNDYPGIRVKAPEPVDDAWHCSLRKGDITSTGNDFASGTRARKACSLRPGFLLLGGNKNVEQHLQPVGLPLFSLQARGRWPSA